MMSMATSASKEATARLCSHCRQPDVEAETASCRKCGELFHLKCLPHSFNAKSEPFCLRCGWTSATRKRGRKITELFSEALKARISPKAGRPLVSVDTIPIRKCVCFFLLSL
jgi:hypothetical protein